MIAQPRQSIYPGQMAPYGALPIPQLTPDLVALIKTGRVYSLAVIHAEGIPVPGEMVPYTLSPRLRHGDPCGLTGSATAAAEVVTMSAHTATHIDALCHIGERQDEAGNPSDNGEVRLYAGPEQTVAAAAQVGFRGQTHLSIAEMPPIVTRAVLLDVAGYKDMEVLPHAYTVTPEDIEGTLVKQGTQVRPGTAVLLRTGFYQHWRDGNSAYTQAIAGLGLAGAKLLVAQGMILVGADNMSVEALPPLDHAVHRFLLVHHGITHVENLYLEELAVQKIYEFLLIVTPLRLLGATGSWVHPIAIA